MKLGPRVPVLRSIETLFGAGSVTGLSDGQLLDQFLLRRDDSAEVAFSALVARHGPLVWSICRSVLSDSHSAEDAFQATFLILVKKAASIRRRETLAPWLYGVARRVAVRARKNAARRESTWCETTEMKASLTQTQQHPEAHSSTPEELEALHQELDRLPEKYRAVLVLCHLESRTHAEAARLLNCPAGTVSARLSRARERLRARLARRGFALSVTAAAAFRGETSWALPPAGLAESTTKAALAFAAGKTMTAGVVSASVLQLTQGVLRTMIVHKFAITAATLLVAGSVTSGFGLLAMTGRSQPQPGASPAGDSPTTHDQPPPAKREAPLSFEDEQKARERSASNLKRISLAMINYAQMKPTMTVPPAAISKDGKPLLSWRVALLPCIDLALGGAQNELYEKFHLDEPWDSPHNKELIDQIPEVYAPVVKKDDPKGSTYYQVFFGPGALFEGSEGKTFQSVTDGISNTLFVVEAAKPVPWTKPEDVKFDITQTKVSVLPLLGGQFDGGFHAVFADGGTSVFIKKSISPAALRALITPSGGEPITGAPATPVGRQAPPPENATPTPTTPKAPEKTSFSRSKRGTHFRIASTRRAP
jgi:RNA polymerase sigma factor (sigma-70 family)